jgi:ketosteroid isomerase-like protein
VPPGPREELEALENRFMRAVCERDMALLDSLLGDDFTLTTGRAGAEVRSRDEWMRITETAYAIDSFEFEELHVQTYPGCAVVRSRYTQEGSMAGDPRNTTFRMTDVWVGEPGRWKLQARHAQPIGGD